MTKRLYCRARDGNEQRNQSPCRPARPGDWVVGAEHQDQERKRAVYEGVEYLTADDVADCILWVVTRPAHVCIEEVVLKPLQQASQDVIVRK